MSREWKPAPDNQSTASIERMLTYADNKRAEWAASGVSSQEKMHAAWAQNAHWAEEAVLLTYQLRVRRERDA